MDDNLERLTSLFQTLGEMQKTIMNCAIRGRVGIDTRDSLRRHVAYLEREIAELV